MLDADSVVADPAAEKEQPETVVVDVSQTSLVVVTPPLVTRDGEQVVNSASLVEVSVHEEDVSDDLVDVVSSSSSSSFSSGLSLSSRLSFHSGPLSCFS